MLNFPEMLNIYRRVGIYNYTFECLLSSNEFKKAYAVDKLRNLKSEDDVLLFIANI